MKISLKDIFQFIAFTSIGALILWWLWKNQAAAYLGDCRLRGIPEVQCSLAEKLISDFKSSNFYWIIAICIIFMLSNVCRALRWNQMLEPLEIKPKLYNSFFIIMVAYFINLGFPRSGEFARAALLTKYEGATFEKTLGTVIMDRILDIICLLIVLALGFILCFDALWAYISQHSGDPLLTGRFGWLIAGGVVIVLMGIGSIYVIFKDDRFAKNRIVSKLRNILRGLWDGMKSVRQVDNIPFFLFYTAAIWFSYFLMTYWMFSAFEPTAHLNAIAGLLVFDMGTLGIVFPSPGGMGTYHAMVVKALEILEINSADGFSFAMIIFFSVNIFCNVVSGLLGLILLPILNRKK